MPSSAGGSGRGQGEDPSDKAQFERRLSDLGSRLDKARDAGGSKAKAQDADLRGKAMGMGFGIAAQLVAGVVVGGGIGFLLDRWLGTAPWLLMVFLLLGFAAGMLNVIRIAREMQKLSEAQSKGARNVPDDEDEDR